MLVWEKVSLSEIELTLLSQKVSRASRSTDTADPQLLDICRASPFPEASKQGHHY